MNELRKYIGPVEDAEIEETSGFDVLNDEHVFIRQQLQLVFKKDNIKIPLGNPEYLEFYNTPKGRERLVQATIEEKQLTAIMLIWGNTPKLEDRADA